MKQSLRAANNAKCTECIGDPCVPALLGVQIERFPARDCPLWAVRPVPKSRRISTEYPFSEAVREFYGLSDSLGAGWLESRGGQEYAGVTWPKASQSTSRFPGRGAARAVDR